MSALDQVFAQCRQEERAALISYLPAGFPDGAGSREAMVAVVEAGADIVEVGVPYTDPLMDGPVIQDAADRALAGGFRVRDLLGNVEAVAATGAVPVVMSYWNLILRYGPDAFARDLAAAGGAGLITPDLIPDEAGAWTEAASTHGIAPIFLVAPSSTDARLQMTAQACQGFVYVASTMGVTGTRSSVGTGAWELVDRTRNVTNLPLCVGLGVSTREQAAEVASFADGVIVGSALVRALAQGHDNGQGVEPLRTLTAELAAGVRGA